MPARLLIFSSDDSNIRYAAGLHIPDPFIYCELAGKKYVLVSKLEYSRAKREAKTGVKVILWEEVKMDNIKKPVQRRRNLADVASAFLLSHGASQVEIPQNCWALHKNTLEEHGIRPKIVSPFFPARRVKSQEDIKKIKAVGLVAKKAHKRATEILKEATIEWNDQLDWNGTRLTSELLRMEIELVFLRHGCSSGESITSCGEQAAEPHNRGSGPLKAGQPIILDLFPRNMKTGYYFDMTRTVVKGTPSKALQRMFDAVKKAQQESLSVLAPGKAGLIHETVQRVFHKLGYKTSESEGFIHGTGHGLGMDIHEFPRIGEKSEDLLEPGMVVTVEPGLYYKDVGGVRIEDTVVITKDGHTNLTNVPKTLIVK